MGGGTLMMEAIRVNIVYPYAMYYTLGECGIYPYNTLYTGNVVYTHITHYILGMWYILICHRLYTGRE